jgi:hypothetical protein
MALFGESSRRHHDEPVPPLQLAMYVRDNEEEVPNAKHMCVGEEEVSLLQPITIVVPSEEEEVQVPQGPTVVVPPKEEEVPTPLSQSRQKEWDSFSRLMTMAPMMKALYRPSFFLKNTGDSSSPFSHK